MNWNIVEGSWKQFKGRMRIQWGKLTRHQVDVTAGRRSVMAGLAQQAFGLTSEAEERTTRRLDIPRKDCRQ